MNISGNTVFIPGATSGIGLALALALQARGGEAGTYHEPRQHVSEQEHQRSRPGGIRTVLEPVRIPVGVRAIGSDFEPVVRIREL
jgi:NAD(P)-dependent dehydrogenase (short-subunit alcohol dehydrogenase family)